MVATRADCQPACAGRRYRRRRPEDTALYRVVQAWSFCPSCGRPPHGQHRLPDPDDDEIAALLAAIRRRLLTRLRRIGALPLEDDDPEPEPALPFDSPTLGACYAAAVRGRDPHAAPVTRVDRQADAPFVVPAGARLVVQPALPHPDSAPHSPLTSPP
ncbi:MAG: hypothetical protein JXQ29_11805 [Planctomycetes bacterium]|nr:hypothetical protein [Planctomycetota bacterium]